MAAAIHPTIRTVVQPAISVAGAMHIAMTSRVVLVVVPVASLCVLDAWHFVSLSFVSTGQRGVAAAKDRCAENEHYQSGFHDPSPFPQVPGPSWLSADYGDHAESRLNGLSTVKQMIAVEMERARVRKHLAGHYISRWRVFFGRIDSIDQAGLLRYWELQFEIACGDSNRRGEPEVWARIRLHESRYEQMYDLAGA
jgi:hypothetical protein